MVDLKDVEGCEESSSIDHIGQHDDYWYMESLCLLRFTCSGSFKKKNTYLTRFICFVMTAAMGE